MTGKELWGSILQKAMEGKLVPQRKEEGTAAELLKEIRKERAKLVKEGKLKKAKALPAVREEEKPFQIPDSWEWVRLGEVSTYGLATQKIKFSDMQPDMWLLDMEDIEKDTGRILRYGLVKEKKVRGDKTVFLKNDILYSKLRPYLKKILIAPADGICTTELVPFQMYGEIDRNYIVMWLMSPLVNQIVNSDTYGVKMPRVGKSTMQNLVLPLPPLSEQHRIVEKLETLKPLVEFYGRAAEELEKLNRKFPEDLKKSLLQQAMEGKLVPQRKEEGTAADLLKRLAGYMELKPKNRVELNISAMDFDIPHTWLFVELNQIVRFVDYRGKTPTKTNQGVFLVTSSNIKRGYLDFSRKEYISRKEYEERKERGITEKGDIIFTTEAPMGNCAINELEECSCGQRLITFKEYEKNTIDLRFLMYSILSPAFQKELLDNCTGTTAKGIKAAKLKKLRLPLPPLAEQHRIVKKLESLLALCDKLQPKG